MNDNNDGAFAHVLADKVVELACNVKYSQEVLKNAEARVEVADQRVIDFNGVLVRTEKEKEEVATSIAALKAKLEKGKVTIFNQIKDCLGDDSKELINELMLENEISLSSLDKNIAVLKKELEAAKKECIESANLVDELNNFANAEAAAATMIDKLNEERIKKSAEDLAQKEAETQAIQEQELNVFKKKIKILERMFNEQKNILLSKDIIIKEFEDERKSVSKIAKLGMTIAGDGFIKRVSSVRSPSSVRSKSQMRTNVRESYPSADNSTCDARSYKSLVGNDIEQRQINETVFEHGPKLKRSMSFFGRKKHDRTRDLSPHKNTEAKYNRA
eukprot:CAMPEP_0194272368 /NCGR_PEP_ID=MMETSP0169-20130528/5958_1 /TAXON_ID=218684 /ORGANISM="Corethron pennatum, Strain L29A3" /LENGTH=330 /DNA_ID=CAMNT_0039015013 /DNA_START=90 /DNA_END=1082 /DNA_ORIENTATION=-